MLAPSGPSTQNIAPVISPSTTPTRPSRLRGLSYLRNYTPDRLLSRSDAPPLIRSSSSPNTSTFSREINTSVPVTTESVTDSTAVLQTSTANTRNQSATTAAPTMIEPSTPSTQSNSRQGERHPTIRFIPHVETRSSRPSLHFLSITKTLRSPNGMIRVGRYTEREQNTPADEVLLVGFKSKVVSRKHCEFWCTNGQWYVKDVKSSSGTFLNHVRLSSPGAESRPYPVNDGDVVQLGIDFKGGEEVMFRCVKIRVECNRGWQKALNTFNTSTHKRLLQSVTGKDKADVDAASVGNSECSICLNAVTPCQCLFVAPCGHVWHYKCVQSLVHSANYPNFLCPNCRAVADLEADVETPELDAEAFEDSDLEDFARGVETEQTTDEAVPGASRASRLEEHTIAEDTSDATDSGGAEEASHTNRASEARSAHPVMSKHSIPQSNMLGVGSTESTAAFPNMIAEGLLTPRNDAGPFILDGSAGGHVNDEVNLRQREEQDSP